MKARWKNPAHPSLSAQADSMTKLAAVEPSLPKSRVFWESNGFDEPTVDRIMADVQRAESRQAITAALIPKGEPDAGA